MAKDFAKSKCFIKTKHGYEEITYGDLLRRGEIDPSYKDRKFLPLHGMLMEVSPADYQAFYKERNRQQYIQRQAAANGDISYDMLTTEDRAGEDILVDNAPDIADQVEEHIMLDKLRTSLAFLPEDDAAIINALFYQGQTERELAQQYGVSHVTIHNRKQRILKALKKLLEN